MRLLIVATTLSPYQQTTSDGSKHFTVAKGTPDSLLYSTACGAGAARGTTFQVEWWQNRGQVSGTLVSSWKTVVASRQSISPPPNSAVISVPLICLWLTERARSCGGPSGTTPVDVANGQGATFLCYFES